MNVVMTAVALPEMAASAWSAFSSLRTIEAGSAVASSLARGTARMQAQSVTVYRVEGAGNTRVMIGEEGQVAIVGNDKRMLFMNFGDKARAQEFLAKRLAQGHDDAIKSFKVERDFYAELREEAVPMAQSRSFPGRPIIVDETRAADQYGLRPEQIEALRDAILQGTGNVSP